MATENPPLPADRPNQTYVTVKALCAGRLDLPNSFCFEDCKDHPDSEYLDVPSFCFLVSHPTKGHAMFDLGIRKDGKGHPPATHQLVSRLNTKCERDAADILQSGGVEPADIDVIIYSHLHWDHVGDPARFTAAEFVLGADALALLSSAYPTNASSPYMALPAGRRAHYTHFTAARDHAQLALAPFGPFACAVDLYGDGSFYLVDAPGHLPGHLIAAARVAPGAFVFLGGDACHNRACYAPPEGEEPRVVAAFIHDSPEAARDTVGRLRRLERAYENAVIVLAHEREREGEMPMFPEALNGWVEEEVRKKKERGVKSSL
ncbi:hypothetical protein EIP86_009349 [Pleurotus ostreatoroseus]|nr:hypothetical protein EIP86_009349 [Pleurotus ostreatoroseus]